MTTRAYSYICSPLPDTAEELLWKVNLFSDLKIVLPPSSLGGAETLKNTHSHTCLRRKFAGFTIFAYPVPPILVKKSDCVQQNPM